MSKTVKITEGDQTIIESTPLADFVAPNEFIGHLIALAESNGGQATLRDSDGCQVTATIQEEKTPIIIVIKNPWTGAMVERDVTELTQDDLDGYANAIDDADREQATGACPVDSTPGQWLAAYVDLVGPRRAGIAIIGS